MFDEHTIKEKTFEKRNQLDLLLEQNHIWLPKLPKIINKQVNPAVIDIIISTLSYLNVVLPYPTQQFYEQVKEDLEIEDFSEVFTNPVKFQKFYLRYYSFAITSLTFLKMKKPKIFMDFSNFVKAMMEAKAKEKYDK